LQVEGTSPESKLAKVFIRTPELFALGLKQDGPKLHKLGEILGFVSFLTLVPLRFCFFENMSALKLVLAQWHYEKIYPDLEIMDVDSMEPIIRHWLCRKGFTSAEHILELEKATGKLSTSLVLLLGILRRNSRKLGDFRNPDKRKGNHTTTGAVAWNEKGVRTITELLQKLSPQVSEAEPCKELSAAADLLPNNAEIDEYTRAYMDQAIGTPAGKVSTGLVKDQYVLALLDAGESTYPQCIFPESDPRAQYLSLHGRKCRVFQLGGLDTRPECHTDYLGISVPANFTKFAQVDIAARLSSKGITHTHKYFIDDLKLESNDPALRLALEARVTNTDGTVQIAWCKSTRNSWKTLFRCNSFVEYLQGVPNEEIILRPRRFNIKYRQAKATIKYTSPVA
jgi:hypothetical protein